MWLHFRLQLCLLNLNPTLETMNYSGLRTQNLDTAATFFFVGLFEEVNIRPNYDIRWAGLSIP